MADVIRSKVLPVQPVKASASLRSLGSKSFKQLEPERKLDFECDIWQTNPSCSNALGD
jgi:hypothetical protein